MIGAWNSTGLTFNGSAVPASPSVVSGFAFVSSKGRGVDYLAFAVADTSSHCAGGVLEASSASPPTVTKATPVTVPAGTSCTGDNVATIAGY